MLHVLSGGDGVVYVCSGAVVREYRDHRGGVCDMCCSGDGGLLVTAGSSDHTLRVWNLNSTARYCIYTVLHAKTIDCALSHSL